MKQGETRRFDCEDCAIEFEVTLEPKMKGKKGAEDALTSAVECCPFCGRGLPLGDHDDPDDDTDDFDMDDAELEDGDEDD